MRDGWWDGCPRCGCPTYLPTFEPALGVGCATGRSCTGCGLGLTIQVVDGVKLYAPSNPSDEIAVLASLYQSLDRDPIEPPAACLCHGLIDEWTNVRPIDPRCPIHGSGRRAR